jgi:hypothetical protein
VVKYYALVGEREKKQSLLPWREKVRMRGGLYYQIWIYPNSGHERFG